MHASSAVQWIDVDDSWWSESRVDARYRGSEYERTEHRVWVIRDQLLELLRNCHRLVMRRTRNVSAGSLSREDSMAKFDAKAVSRDDWGVIGAGGVALICLFLPWYGVSSGPFSVSESGFSTGYGWLGALLIIASGLYLLALRSQVDLSKMPTGPGVAVFGASVVGTVLVILRWLTLPSAHGGVTGVPAYRYSYGPRVGIILTLLVGLVQVFFAMRFFRASGEKLPWSSAHPSTGAGSSSSAP